ncbi:MAG: DUF2304 domain-containing protein [Bacteroidales bacterium]|nr:DUF2304 domain-containing protein [Bacteroidales bacterium]
MIHLIFIQKIQLFAISASILLFFFLIHLVRKRRIKVEYSLLWLFFGMIFIVFSTWRTGLDYIADIVGIAYPPAAMFLLFMLAFFFILIEFSTIISKLSDRNKNLTQEIGLLKMEFRELQNKIELNDEKESYSTE